MFLRPPPPSKLWRVSGGVVPIAVGSRPGGDNRTRAHSPRGVRPKGTTDGWRSCNMVGRQGNIPQFSRTLHFIHIDSCTDILYYCTQLVQMDGLSVQLDTTYSHLRCTHYAWISCTTVRYTVVQSMYVFTVNCSDQ